METIDEFLKKIPEIPESTNYWFFRTMGGRLYYPFLFKSIIALNYSKIRKEEAYELIDGEINEKKINFIRSKYPDYNRPGLIISNLKRFYLEMQIGDLIIIPDFSGRNIAVGKIDGDIEDIDGIERVKHDGKIYIDRDYKRSRKITWITAVKRGGFSPELFRLLNTHQTISKANAYAEWIDNLLYSFYKKSNKYHYIVKITQKYGIGAKTVYWTFAELLTLTDNFLKTENIDESVDSIETKISLHSPGYIEFLGLVPYAISLLAILVLLINGGGFKIKYKDDFSLDLSTLGIIKRLSEFLNSKQDRKTKEALKEKITNLNIENPSDFVDILNSINQKNQNEKDN